MPNAFEKNEDRMSQFNERVAKTMYKLTFDTKAAQYLREIPKIPPVEEKEAKKPSMSRYSVTIEV